MIQEHGHVLPGGVGHRLQRIEGHLVPVKVPDCRRGGSGYEPLAALILIGLQGIGENLEFQNQIPRLLRFVEQESRPDRPVDSCVSR